MENSKKSAAGDAKVWMSLGGEQEKTSNVSNVKTVVCCLLKTDQNNG